MRRFSTLDRILLILLGGLILCLISCEEQDSELSRVEAKRDSAGTSVPTDSSEDADSGKDVSESDTSAEVPAEEVTSEDNEVNTGSTSTSTPGVGTVPVHSAGGVSFTDGDGDKGQISGEVLITKANDQSDITEYVLYWGSGESAKLTGAKPIISIKKKSFFGIT